MYNFATLFDSKYLAKGLAMYDSLQRHCPEFVLYILCLDSETYEVISSNPANFPNTVAVRLSEIENSDEALVNAKSNRSLVEYYFTLSPILPLYLFKAFSLDHVCTLDADLYFFSDPGKILYPLKEYSVILTPHKFSQDNLDSLEFGRFNVSFQVFRNDSIGVQCLHLWRTQCLVWCYDRLEGDKFADQKYLDRWPSLYTESLYSLDDNVSGLAPWNVSSLSIEYRNQKFYSNGEPIVYYHFHGFKVINRYFATNSFSEYKVRSYRDITNMYLIYWDHLLEKMREFPEISMGSSRSLSPKRVWIQIIASRGVYFRVTKDRLFHFNFYFLFVWINKLKSMLKI